jgi:hypothetical protein
MEKFVIALLIALAACGPQLWAAPILQNQQNQTKTAPRQTGTDLSDYGVQIQPEPRLIAIMVALEAAGFDAGPAAARQPFRAQVRSDLASLDKDLRARLSMFYERNKLPAPATPAEQAARYISLALALGPPPAFETPRRTDDLPAAVLDLLDFAPLLRDFYRQPGMEARLSAYASAYQAEASKLAEPAALMVRSVLSYLHTRPVTTAVERVPVKTDETKSSKKQAAPKYTFKEHPRRFIIVPDLLAVPGAINFRAIADDYYVVVPPTVNPVSSEMRRAYLQYVVDPLAVRFNRDISARREAIKQVLDARKTDAQNNAAALSIFQVVTRSLVAAADARINETARLQTQALDLAQRLRAAKDEAARAALRKEDEAERARVADETTAQLAEAYEQGAILAFYFAEQLRGLETSGFDITNSFADMMASFDPAREIKRPGEYAAARTRALAARAARRTAESGIAEPEADTGRARLIKRLAEVEDLVRQKNYDAAEQQLLALRQEYEEEPRILYALAQVWSGKAQNAFDEELQAQRLTRALSFYDMAIQKASPETDRPLLLRAHVARGRIFAFFDKTDEALKEFDAALKIGLVDDSVHKEAQEWKQKLTQQK